MINRAVLVGRLTRDPDLRYTPSGVAVANFTLAVDRQFKNQNGEREADFINCVIWRKSAETLANYTHKGALIAVEGRIQTRSYDDQNGNRVYRTEVVADNFSFLESKADSERYRQQNGGQGAPQSNGAVQNTFSDNQDFGMPAGGNPTPAQGPADSAPTNNRQDSDPFADNGNGDTTTISENDLPF